MLRKATSTVTLKRFQNKDLLYLVTGAPFNTVRVALHKLSIELEDASKQVHGAAGDGLKMGTAVGRVRCLSQIVDSTSLQLGKGLEYKLNNYNRRVFGRCDVSSWA